MNTDLKRWIELALVGLELFAKWTATTVDDQAVAFLKAALSNPAVLAVLEVILNDTTVQSTTGEARTDAIRTAFNASASPEVKNQLAASSISLSLLMQTILPAVIRLLLTYMGKRDVPAVV
jgi:hypothetical protein